MRSREKALAVSRAWGAWLIRIVPLAILVVAVAVGCGRDENAVRPDRTHGAQEPATGDPVDDPQGDGTLIVTVRTDRGPVAWARVDVYNEEPGSPLYNILTDSLGLALLDLEAGIYAVRLEVPEGFALAAGQENPLAGVQVGESDSTLAGFLLLPEGAPAGDGLLQVRVSTGPEPRAGVEIRVLESGTSQPLATGTTGPEGGVAFALAPALYDVALVVPAGWELWPGQANPIRDVPIHAVEVQEVSILIHESGVPFPPGTLVVQAWADSLPVADAVVTVLPDGGGDPVATVATGAEGRVDLDLDAGAYAVRIDPPAGYVLPEGHPNPLEGILVRPFESTWAGFYLQRGLPEGYGRTLAPDQVNPVSGVHVEAGGCARVRFDLLGPAPPAPSDTTRVDVPFGR